MTPPKSAAELAGEFFDEHVFNAKEFPDLPIENSITMRAYLAGHAAGLAEAGELRTKQLEIAIECLEKYRTLTVSHTNTPTYRLGKHAEDALELMAEMNTRFKALAGDV